MRFLDTNNTQPNSEIVYTLVQSMFLNTLKMGLLCLAGGVSYYSWNYYKSKNKDLNTATDQKNDIENKLSQIKNENNSDNITKLITNYENDNKEVAQENKKLDNNNVKNASDMLEPV